jgi:hypothetical protein
MRADDVKYPKSDPDGMASTETPAPLSGKQYNMLRYEGSALTVEWTSQHGCGGRESDDPNKVRSAANDWTRTLTHACTHAHTHMPSSPHTR